MFLFFLVLLTSSSAFSQFEEYSYFSESELNEVNTPLLIDSEYFSDMLTYRMPLSMHSTFLRSDRAFDLTIGSLSRTRFATQYRMKLDTQLNDTLTFRLVYFEKKDLEQSLNHFVLELQQRLNSFFSIVGYTELKSEKKWNDIGAAVLLDFAPDHTLRLYTTWIDFSFNKRTEDNESDSRKAVAYGFVGRLLDENHPSTFVEYYGLVQSPLNRQLDVGINYIYKETKLGLRGTRTGFAEDHLFHFDVGYRYRTEGRQEVGVFDRTVGLWRTDQVDLLLQYENARWIYGLSTALRSWKIRADEVSGSVYSPHLWYKWIREASGQEQLRLGYEASLHSMSGPLDLRSASDLNKDAEHRGNLRYTIHFNEKAFLHLQMTADLDDLGWEGGNGTFQILF